jgi:hypothetical protein
MIPRLVYSDLRDCLAEFPAVAILGPRQVGKTTLAKQLAAESGKSAIYLDLERPSDREKLGDAETYLSNHNDKCVIIDEVQTLPHLYATLRPLIDEHRVPGRFLLLGSASPALVKGVSESLAGRVAYVELGQINISEALQYGIPMDKHWFRGGFPEALLATSNKQFNRWSEYFVRSYVERDMEFIFGVEFSQPVLRNLWNMLAHLNGTVLNKDSLARSLGITSPTVSRYLDYMEGAFLVNRLPAWFVNAKKRLVKSPKIYLRCSGLVHQLVGLNDFEQLQGHPVVGGSWEGYVVEQIQQLKSVGIALFYYRTQNGAEADIVLVKGITPIACIEIKYSNAPQISAGFYTSIADLKTKHNFVITPATETYPLKDKIMVCNLSDFIKNYLPSLGQY